MPPSAPAPETQRRMVERDWWAVNVPLGVRAQQGAPAPVIASPMRITGRCARSGQRFDQRRRCFRSPRPLREQLGRCGSGRLGRRIGATLVRGHGDWTVLAASPLRGRRRVSVLTARHAVVICTGSRARCRICRASLKPGRGRIVEPPTAARCRTASRRRCGGVGVEMATAGRFGCSVTCWPWRWPAARMDRSSVS